MIASWRGLAIAAVIAVVLAITVAVDLGRTRGAKDRALVPGFDPDRVTELVWERAGRPAIRVVRAGDAWETRSPSSTSRDAVAHVPADASAVGDVLAALRGARWHRRGAPTPVHATLTVVAGTERHVLGIGEPIAGTEQTWIVRDGRGVVVDRWAARALDRDLLALRIKAPLADVRGAQTIVIEGESHARLRIDGRPRQLHAPDGFVLAADVAGELERALAGVTIVRLPDGPITARGLTITATGMTTGTATDTTIGTATGTTPGAATGTIPGAPTGGNLARGDRAVVRLILGGSCPGAPELVAVAGTVGDGCIERAAADGVERAIGRLLQPAAAIVERRPVPFEPQRIVLADAVPLDAVALRVGDAPADPSRVTELYAALAAPAEVAALPTAPATAHLVITGHTGATITLDLFAEHVLARDGEPIALRPASGAWSLLVRPSRELRDVMLWLEEPTMITTVRIDAIRYQRGAILGAWTRLPAGAANTTGAQPADTRPADARTLESLVSLLAAPRSQGFVDDPFAITHRVTLVVTPPVGAPTEHVLALGAPRPAGCPARLDHDTILLPALVCAQVAALAK